MAEELTNNFFDIVEDIFKKYEIANKGKELNKDLKTGTTLMSHSDFIPELANRYNLSEKETEDLIMIVLDNQVIDDDIPYMVSRNTFKDGSNVADSVKKYINGEKIIIDKTNYFHPQHKIFGGTYQRKLPDTPTNVVDDIEKIATLDYPNQWHNTPTVKLFEAIDKNNLDIYIKKENGEFLKLELDDTAKIGENVIQNSPKFDEGKAYIYNVIEELGDVDNPRYKLDLYSSNPDELSKLEKALSNVNFDPLANPEGTKFELIPDTPTNVVDEGIELYHSRAKGVDLPASNKGLHAGTYNAALDKAAMQYNNINFYNWAFDAQEQIAIAHNNLVDIVSGDLQLELEDLTEGNSIPFEREEPVYIEWVTGEETEYILKIEGEVTLQDGEYINDLKANLYTGDMDGYQGDLILELETDVSYADIEEIANNPDIAKISKSDSKLLRPGIDSQYSTNSLEIAEDLLENIGTGYSFQGERGYDLYKVNIKPNAKILELPGEIVLQINGRDVTWTADELQNTLIDTDSDKLTDIEKIIIGDKTIEIPDEARRKDVSKLLFGDYNVITYKNQGEDVGSTSYLFKDSNSYTIEKIDDVKFNDDVNKKFYGTNKYDYYSDKAYKFKDQPTFKKYQVKEYNPNFTFTDTPGGSLGAAKLNDPLVFDSWIDNYTKTTTSFVDNLPLSTTVKNQFNNLVQGRARNLATPGGVADAVDVWELGVLGLMIAAIAYKEYDEIPTILTNKAVDMFNSMTASYGIPPVPKEQYNLDYEFINKVVETGEKFMPTDIIIKKVGDVVKGAAETGAVTGFGYVPTTPKKTDTMETTQKIQPGVQEEKMFEQARPKKSKATGGAGAKIL